MWGGPLLENTDHMAGALDIASYKRQKAANELSRVLPVVLKNKFLEHYLWLVHQCTQTMRPFEEHMQVFSSITP